MKHNWRTLTLAASAFVMAASLSFGWSEQGGVTLSIDKAAALARVYIRTPYAASAVYVGSANLPWYAVRAYYFGGPWSGLGYSYAGWADYKARTGIACDPGSVIAGQDGIMYRCQ